MRAGRSTALVSLLRPFAALAAFALLLAGCASFPRPSAQNDSLFVFLSENPAPRVGPESGGVTLRFQGPSSFGIRTEGDERRIYAIRVKAGRYTLAGSDLAAAAPASASSFEIPAGAIYLYPVKFTRVREQQARVSRLVPLASEDQKNASALLTDYLDYEKWFGRVVVGFGAYPPRLNVEEGDVPFEITSTPAGAQVTIDDQEWGATPVTATLHTGKHLVQLEIPGVALTRSFVDVLTPGSVNIVLPMLPSQEAKDLKDKSQRITILLSGFQNMGTADNDNLRSVFPEVIGQDLGGDQRIVLVDAGELVAGGNGIPGKPDFAVANAKGIDLIVSGYYAARQDSLMVYAALYDVRTELPRASIMYTGKAGLAMFDSIDAMATQFIRGIDKALPEVRTSAVQHGGTVQSQVVSYEKKRSETAIIDTRQALRSSLTFITGPSVAAINGSALPALPGAILAVSPLGVIYDYSLGGPFSLMAILQPAIAFDIPASTADPNAPYTKRPYVDIPLKLGPEYTLFGYNGDLSFAFWGEGRFIQAWFDGSAGKVYDGNWLFGLGLETSARLYLQSRISERPTYIFIGFSWFLVGMQTDFDLTRPRITPLEVALSLGYGFRL